MASGAASQNFFSSNPMPATQMPLGGWRQHLPFTRQDTGGRTITCYDYLGNQKIHGPEQRYVSPTTGVCRKLNIQAVHPKASNERHIRDHTDHVSKLALRLTSINPLHPDESLEWAKTWLWFTFKLFWSLIWFIAQVLMLYFGLELADESSEGSEAYRTGYYKPYQRTFTRQLWEARSEKEHSTRDREEGRQERNIITRSLYPRLVMIHDPTQDKWVPCTDPTIIKGTKYIAISYASADVYPPDSDKEREKELFAQEVRLAAIEQNFNAYWLDLECVGETQDEKNLAVYCMADVYRRAESTLIILGNARDGEQAAWKRWGARVWTLPEALLSKRLLYKFRDRTEINSVSLHQLANLAYSQHDSEQAVINAYGGNDPLERLERLSLLKLAIWRRDMSFASAPISLPPEHASSRTGSGPHAAERVYALMGFFDHRIQPSYTESELRALARLSMANDSDRIAERMVSMLCSELYQEARWYADHDIYGANLWDILPEIQVAGITENGALVLDGCRTACIRWKDFPLLVPEKTSSFRRGVMGYLPYLAWPALIVGIVVVAANITSSGGAVLVAVGFLLLLAAPKLFVFSEGGRVVDAQPWFIGVKGILDNDTAAKYLYGGGNKGRYRRIDYTPSGSEFATPDRQGLDRGGSREQYNRAKDEEAGGAQMFTLVDTYGESIYYFRAMRPPTVCLFTGREGGLGRFVLCSERCDIGELHKETVLRMPTYVSDRMEMNGWIALG